MLQTFSNHSNGEYHFQFGTFIDEDPKNVCLFYRSLSHIAPNVTEELLYDPAVRIKSRGKDVYVPMILPAPDAKICKECGGVRVHLTSQDIVDILKLAAQWSLKSRIQATTSCTGTFSNTTAVGTAASPPALPPQGTTDA